MLGGRTSAQLASNVSSDDVIRHIIKEIIARCTPAAAADAGADHPPGSPSGSPEGHRHSDAVREPTFLITETLAAFMVRAIVVDPSLGFKVDKELSKAEVERLVQNCVDRLLRSNDPVIEAIKLQIFFDTNFPAQNDYLEKDRKLRLQRCVPVLRDIHDVKTKTVAVMDSLYRNMVSYILLQSCVGSIFEISVVREATAALESVFPQSELGSLISLTKAEKELQLNDLSALVTGIRLFNRELGKGGSGIDDLPNMCNDEISSLEKSLAKHAEITNELIIHYLAVLDYAETSPPSKPKQPYTPKHDLDEEEDPTITPESIDTSRLKSELIFRRQFLLYLEAIKEQISASRQSLTLVQNKYDRLIKDLKFTCRSKAAVPVDLVYPQFMALANLWREWQDELFLLIFRRGILNTSIQLSSNFEIALTEDEIKVAAPFVKRPDTTRIGETDIIERASGLMTELAMIGQDVEVFHPGNTTNYSKLPVEYAGFCPYVLVSRNGLLVPGDKTMGVVRYKDRLYAFHDRNSAKAFAAQPERIMESVVELAKRCPNLVHMLQLYPHFPTVDALEKARSFARQRLLGQMPMVSETGCQTETHPIEANWDNKYQWNEWSMRKEALMLVNLRTKQTHAAQTELSHFRRDSETQHYAMKTNYAQTKRTKATNVPRKVNYIAGLRNGDPRIPNQARVVDLTLDF